MDNEMLVQTLNVVKQELECVKRQNGTICDNARDCSTCDLRCDEDTLVDSYEFMIQLLEHIIELNRNNVITCEDQDHTAKGIINEFEAKINQLDSEILDLKVELDKYKILSKVLPIAHETVSVKVRNFKKVKPYDRCRIRYKTI